jgi:hypothetical protein
MWFVVGWSNPHGRIESPSNLLVTVSILPAYVLQKFWPNKKAIMVAGSCGPAHQCEKYRILVQWVMMRTRIKIEDNVGRFTIFLMDQSASRSPLYICNH